MSTPNLPDNRLRFPAPTIDFDTEVGTTGQDHDNYPSPNTQARYDWMRMCLLALLSHQASYQAPTQYRDGTVWYDLNTLEFKVWSGGTTDGSWVPLAAAINVALDGTAPIFLSDFYQDFLSLKIRVAKLEGK